MFREQCEWAKQEGVDFIIAETIDDYGEAKIAVEEILRVGLPAVVTLAIQRTGKLNTGEDPNQAILNLAKAGATVVGFNCARGPAMMYEILKESRKVLPANVGLAALPVPFRTTPENPTFQSLCKHEAMYQELEPHTHTRIEMAEWARKFRDIGVNYMGVCCGGEPYMIRAMCEGIGRKTPASNFSPDISKHFAFGSHESFKPWYTSDQYKGYL